jgi:hypothetical protein
MKDKNVNNPGYYPGEQCNLQTQPRSGLNFWNAVTMVIIAKLINNSVVLFIIVFIFILGEWRHSWLLSFRLKLTV